MDSYHSDGAEHTGALVLTVVGGVASRLDVVEGDCRAHGFPILQVLYVQFTRGCPKREDFPEFEAESQRHGGPPNSARILFDDMMTPCQWRPVLFSCSGLSHCSRRLLASTSWQMSMYSMYGVVSIHSKLTGVCVFLQSRPTLVRLQMRHETGLIICVL